MPACYSTTYCEKAGILKRDRAPHDEWHIDWAVMGQGTLGLNGEAYVLAVLDVGSGLGAVINTKTREDPWQKLEELTALWGNHPKAVRCDGAAEFEHSDGFKAWRRKHNITFNPVEPYRHTMQGYIENLVKQMKVHSRCILKHANLPPRCVFECVVTVSSTGAKNRFKEMTTATSGVLARFPLLLPIRNPCELRGLCRRSYLGPRTFGGGETNVIEVSGLSIRVSPSHP
jgi:hypothetical protein